jgi:hypothetical protein
MNVLTAGFEKDIEHSMFEVQYTCRKTSIATIFNKNLLSSFITVVIFQYCNLVYLGIFASKQMDKFGNNYESKLEYVKAQMVDFQTVLLVGNGAAVACLLSVVTQFIFNAFSFYNLPFDTWTMVDLFNAITNMTVFTTLNLCEAEIYLDKAYKDMIDMAFIAMICASWLRFGSFFLVVESFSILILTLFKMFADAKTFLIITLLYFLVAMSIFRALFQE